MPVHIIVKFRDDSKWVDPIQINWRLHLNNLQVLLVHKLHCLLIVICALVQPEIKGIRSMVIRARQRCSVHIACQCSMSLPEIVILIEN